jgi:hypothetical protein
MQLGFATPAPVLAASLMLVVCFVLTGCSPGADYPSLFPGVHDRPPARSDAPLDANQVQQATEDLISARERLSAEAQSGQGKTSTKAASTKPASAKPASARTASTVIAKKPPSAAPAANPAARQAIGTDGTQPPSAETK